MQVSSTAIKHMRGVAGRVMHAGNLHDDQARAAGGTRLVVGDQLIGDHAVVDHDRVVPGGHDRFLIVQWPISSGVKSLGKEVTVVAHVIRTGPPGTSGQVQNVAKLASKTDCDWRWCL